MQNKFKINLLFPCIEFRKVLCYSKYFLLFQLTHYYKIVEMLKHLKL
jgi:hypothetical protein